MWRGCWDRMASLTEIIAKGTKVGDQRPWPRLVVDAAQWQAIAEDLRSQALVLSGLWGDADSVHVALLDEARGEMAVATYPCPAGRFPSIGKLHPPAIRLERAIHDLFGHVPEGAPDLRPWLDHGHWNLHHPLGARMPGADAPSYAFLPAEGEGLHQIAVGPIHAGIIEPGHFRFSANGEAIVRLEERFGYTHKGVESLMHGLTLDRAARLAGRISGDSTVAYALAFARATEAALCTEVPPRAHWLRA